MSKVSVIIPTYNAPKYLVCAVDSVLNQTYKDYEIIIVDDGSDQLTREEICPYMEQFSNIRYLYQDNKGPAAARNKGIEASSGEYIAFLDHDDIWLPNKLEVQMKLFNEGPSVGLVYCRFKYLYEDSGIIKEDYREYCSGQVLDRFLSKNYIPTTSLVIARRECFSTLGGLDESLRIVDDYDFYIRVAQRYEFAYSDECLVIWRRHADSMSLAAIEMAENTIKMRQRLLFSDSLTSREKRTVRVALRKEYWKLGYLLLTAEKLNEARNSFLKGLPHELFRSTVYLASSYLPIPVFRSLRNVKRKFCPCKQILTRTL